MDVREKLKNGALLMDGSMGTYLSSITGESNMDCEMAVLERPDLILDIHRQYLEAGCQAIKTNTYNANRMFYHGDEELTIKVIREAVRLANEAIEGHDAVAFADIGPIKGKDEKSITEEFVFTVSQFIDAGMENFVFETHSSPEGIIPAVEYIRERVPDAFVIVMYAVQPDGYSMEGYYAGDMLHDTWNSGIVDAVGLNCICGAREMLDLYYSLDCEGMTISFSPSAGFPTVVNNRIAYNSDPNYFGISVAEMIAHGIKIVGGCCGTTPEHIQLVAQRMDSKSAFVPRPGQRRKQYSAGSSRQSAFWEKLRRGEKVIAVELDPPRDADITKFIQGAYELKDAGADIITLADCPVGRVRMDSSLLACKLTREVEIEAMPHLTCRDRNINATKALLLGLHAEGIKNILLVTGDPIPSAERAEIKAVYQYNSRKLASYVRSLGETSLSEPFHIFGALNVNSRNFDIQLQLAKDKEKKGMVGLLTQPILSEQALDNLKKARDELNCFIIGGLFPPVSAKNARFMDSEVNGIVVSPEIIDRYDGLERDQAEDLAVELITDIAKKAKPYVDGFYIMTPFQRTKLVSRIINNIK